MSSELNLVISIILAEKIYIVSTETFDVCILGAVPMNVLSMNLIKLFGKL
jgi:hypothetical protein